MSGALVKLCARCRPEVRRLLLLEVVGVSGFIRCRACGARHPVAVDRRRLLALDA